MQFLQQLLVTLKLIGVLLIHSYCECSCTMNAILRAVVTVLAAAVAVQPFVASAQFQDAYRALLGMQLAVAQ